MRFKKQISFIHYMGVHKSIFFFTFKMKRIIFSLLNLSRVKEKNLDAYTILSMT